GRWGGGRKGANATCPCPGARSIAAAAARSRGLFCSPKATASGSENTGGEDGLPDSGSAGEPGGSTAVWGEEATGGGALPADEEGPLGPALAAGGSSMRGPDAFSV